ncbi:MAG: hypothetical protein DLM69_02995 [Candidatus Chloroheliales bacterium]|nr:MAG: hypothetical protein DLM69_02995 [Chloroflexota bacterium]
MNKLRSIREKKGLTLGQLSARAGIPSRLINDYEIGQQLIPLPHAKLLAKALWVKVEDILPPASPLAGIATPPPASPRPTSPPPDQQAPPPPADGQRPTSAEQGVLAPRPGWGSQPKPKPDRPPKPPKPEPVILPATEGQVLEILRQGNRAGLTTEEIAAEVGKPLTELDRMQAREWIRNMRERAAGLSEEAKKSPATTKLPDDREPEYINAQQKAGAIFSFTMFDGQIFTGQIKEYTPYTIVIIGDDGNDVVLRKLAIAYYQKVGTGNPLATLTAAEQSNEHNDGELPKHKGEVKLPHAPAATAGMADDGEPGFYGPDGHARRQEEDDHRDDVADTPSPISGEGSSEGVAQ